LADYATANITKRLQGGIGGGKVVVVTEALAHFNPPKLSW
jgi:hypothetical protein